MTYAAAAASVASPVRGLATEPPPAPAANPAPAPAEPTRTPATHADRSARAAAAPLAVPSTSAPVIAATPPTDAAPLGRIRPTLSAEDRQLAKQQAASLRGTAAAAPAATAAPARAVAPAATVYAVVTRPSRQRETAASGLVVMRAAAARLSPPAPVPAPAPTPAHIELMQQQGEWRAAWWPFASQVDAERARTMLATRGLRAEVVAF